MTVRTKDMQGLQRFFVTLGAILIGLGATVLVFLGLLCFQVITAPQDVTLVQFVLEHVRAGDTAIYGHATDATTGRKMDFVLNWSESVRTISFLLMGIAVLGVLAGIAKALISAGVNIMRLLAPQKKTDKT